MPKSIRFQFKIGAFTPDTLPMARLGEYLTDLAAILGNRTRVHFDRLDEGSAKIVGRVEAEAALPVKQRANDVRRGVGTEEAMEAYHRMNARLRDDKTKGVLTGLGKVIAFPGFDDEEEQGAFTQDDVIDGVVVRLGGTTLAQPVHIRSGSAIYSVCVADEAIVKQLGHHIQQDELRFYGRGRWRRNLDGEWELKSFRITGFVPLDQAPLDEVVKDLRGIKGDWPREGDPWVNLGELHRGEQ